MFCSRLRNRPRLPRLRPTSAHGGSRRSFGTAQMNAGYHHQLPPVRIIGPIAWSMAAVGTIYFGCAAFDVYQDAKKWVEKGSKGTVTFEEIEVSKSMAEIRRSRRGSSSGGPLVISSPLATFHSLDGPDKFISTIATLNVGSLVASRFPPLVEWHLNAFSHVPAGLRNSTLLTSSFAHSGAFHLFVNMYMLITFGRPVVNTPTFGGSGSHLAAFYLSSGVVSALGQHLSSSVWPNRGLRLSPTVGASGAICAILAAWCMSYADSRIGILFLPWSWRSDEFLAYSAAFETIGVLSLLRWIPVIRSLAHAAHLTGMGVGWAYIAHGGKEKMWTPARRAAFGTMRRLKMI